MKTSTFLPAIALAFTFLSCSTSDILVSKDLQNQSTEMQVSGNNGLLIGQKIKFGDYSTTPVKRSLTDTEQITVTVFKNTEAKQRLSFVQQTPFGKTADVVAMSIYQNNGLDLLKGFEKYITSFTNSYIGSVMAKDNAKNLRFVIINDNSNSALKENVNHGYALTENDEVIEIRGTKQLQKNTFLTNDAETFGYEFFKDGNSIGAVSVIRNGKVWINKNLSNDMKLMISGLASALIAKRDVKP